MTHNFAFALFLFLKNHDLCKLSWVEEVVCKICASPPGQTRKPTEGRTHLVESAFCLFGGKKVTQNTASSCTGNVRVRDLLGSLIPRLSWSGTRTA